MKFKTIIDNMTLEEKLSLITGKNVWETSTIPRLNIPSIFMADGPHGLRKQVDTSDNLGINASYPATLYPSSALSACSFDEDLFFELGKHLALEAKSQGVNLVLGPGINIKRHPFGGRNFEYYSEDPLLAGRLGKAWIKGIESEGVGACVKHFVCNNQETNRFLMNAGVDKRTLNEIYLRPFQIALEGKPSALMTSYNLVNGTYVHASVDLIKKVREDWQYQGCIISDWGAVDNRIPSLKAGLNLEMPSSGNYYYAKINQALKQKTLTMRDLDTSVNYVLDLVYKLYPKKPNKEKVNDFAMYHKMAYKVASESMVLLQNQGTLPLAASDEVILIGEMVKSPRLQGGGSSHIVPQKVDQILDLLPNYTDKYQYLRDDKALLKGQNDEELVKAQKIVLILGLNEADETEGMDRLTLELPQKYQKLIQKLSPYLSKTILVLMSGSVVSIPKREQFGAIIYSGLMGQAGAMALLDIIYGKVNPSGKLTETYANQVEDYPSHAYFPGNYDIVPYVEGIFVGYRYFVTKNIHVAFPFGHGLSYTQFSYQDIKCNKKAFSRNTEVKIVVKVANIGDRDGKETVQLYLRKKDSRYNRPDKVLIDFKKLLISPKKTMEYQFTLSSSAFSIYDDQSDAFIIEPGEYEIIAGANCLDEPLITKITYEGEGSALVTQDELETIDQYMTTAHFAKRMESINKIPKRKRPYTLNDSFRILRRTFIGRLVFLIVKKAAMKVYKQSKEPWMQKVIKATLLDTPLRTLAVMSSGAITLTQAEGIVDLINGKIAKGIKKLKNKNLH